MRQRKTKDAVSPQQHEGSRKKKDKNSKFLEKKRQQAAGAVEDLTEAKEAEIARAAAQAEEEAKEQAAAQAAADAEAKAKAQEEEDALQDAADAKAKQEAAKTIELLIVAHAVIHRDQDNLLSPEELHKITVEKS